MNGLSKLFILLLAVTAVVFVSSPAQAAKAHRSVTGTVVSFSSDELVLRTDKGDMRFSVDEDTQKAAELNLAEGNRVTVWYDSGANPAEHIADARRIGMAASASSSGFSSRREARANGETKYHARRELPRTASPISAIAGAGLLVLAAGALLRKRALRG